MTRSIMKSRWKFEFVVSVRHAQLTWDGLEATMEIKVANTEIRNTDVKEEGKDKEDTSTLEHPFFNFLEKLQGS